MRSLAQSVSADFAGVEFVLTDMDDTLTYRGRLAAATFDALERLQDAGIKVIPVTAAPAGWCDQMVRMWPVDAVVGENGGVTMLRRDTSIEYAFWSRDARGEATCRLAALRADIASRFPSATLASDQPFRLTSLAFNRPSDGDDTTRLSAFIRASGADAVVNSLWVLAYFGGYDKLSAARRLLAYAYGVDIDSQRDAVVYVGDSANDAPMFAHFPRSVGVNTVVEYLAEIEKPPEWITRGPGGSGFVEVANSVLAARR